MSEIFNCYSATLEMYANMLLHSIMHLLRPGDGFPKVSDDIIQENYALWQKAERDMDAACGQSLHSDTRPSLVMPPDDEEHAPCRRMAAVLIERNVTNHLCAGRSLIGAVEEIRANLDTCAHHLPNCACHAEGNGYPISNCKWTGANMTLVEDLGRDLEIKRRSDLTEFTSMGGNPGPPPPHDTDVCLCLVCTSGAASGSTL